MKIAEEKAPNILIVDDNLANVLLLEKMLAARGYATQVVLSGKLALQAARATPPDLILLDIDMPLMDGYELCRLLKADGLLQEIPVIFVSAMNETVDKVKAFRVGGVDYVTKPFQLDEVYARVQTHLKISFLQRRLNQQNENLERLLGEVRDAREYAENIVETVRKPLVVLDSALKILSANQSFYDMFMVTPKETLGNFIYDLGSRQWDLPRLRLLFEEILPNDSVFSGYDVEADFPVIGRKIIRLNARQIYRKDIGSHIILLAMEDITEQKKNEEMLRHVGSHDKLTGLYNRTFFDEELERLSREGTFPIGIVMADVNGLKMINDCQGHAAGDQVIRLAARIILRAFRAGDVVARIGGDEFAILMPETRKSVAEDAVERIMNSSEITNGQVSIAFGVGSAENGGMLGEALKLSDRRMYRDKAEQKVTCYFHGPVSGIGRR